MPRPNNSKKAVLLALKYWKYSKKKASGYNIAKETGYSWDMVNKVLRELLDHKIVTRSIAGSYHLNITEEVKEKLHQLRRSGKSSSNMYSKNNNNNEDNWSIEDFLKIVENLEVITSEK